MTIHICSVSGGKDSSATYAWMIDQFGKDGFRAVFSDTGNEHPVTLNYVRNMHLMIPGPVVEWVTADFERLLDRRGIEPTGSAFLDMCLVKGRVPSAAAQFCTENLKLQPIRAWLDTFRGDEEVIIYTGIRRGESKRRSTYEKEEYLAYYDAKTIRPLIDWSEEQVFAFLKEKGITPNPLYEAGFSRVGCFPCIHSRKSELARLPDWAWDKLQEWETKIGRSWFSYGEIPLSESALMELSAIPKISVLEYDEEEKETVERLVPDPVILAEFKNRNSPSVAQAREWAKTSRGGAASRYVCPRCRRRSWLREHLGDLRMKRRCPCCTDWFELDGVSFYRASREASGFDRYCKGCRRVINRPHQRNWKERYPDLHREQSRNYLIRKRTVAAATKPGV